MRRRTLIGYGLMLAGSSRRVWAQLTTAPPRYSALTQPVRIPLASVTMPWRPVSFVGEAVLPSDSATPGRRVLIKGVLFRKELADKSTAAGSPSAAAALGWLSALCVTCPHEQCPVALVTDPERLAKMSGSTDGHPMFECGCHFSKFDAVNDGAWISGVAYRGLFRFRIGAVTDGTVEINEIEEEALSVV